jgi:hypothetical protein
VPAKKVYEEERRKRCPAYSGMSARVTFLGQLQPKLAMLVG